MMLHKSSKHSLKKLECSPKLEGDVIDYTCYSVNELHKLKMLWNSRHSDDEIITNSTKAVHDELSSRLQKVCDKESCWLKQLMNFQEIKKNNFLKSFAPVSPASWLKNPNEWLSSSDISKVMKQYEDTYKCFSFIGPSPIDFDKRKLYGTCVWEELCNFNLGNFIDDKKTKIGIIFNTDPHYLSGSHWVSLFINIKKKQIMYFDSVGTKIPSQIMTFVERVKDQGLKHHIAFKFDTNEGFSHQKSNTECGIYSLYFIVHMLKDKINERYLKTHRIGDKHVEKFRKVYFNDNLL